MKLLLVMLFSAGSVWSVAGTGINGFNRSNHACTQGDAQVRSLGEEAEKNGFRVRRVEITGNPSIRHREFVKRLGRLNEGNLFTQSALRAAIKQVSKIKAIQPIGLANFELRLDSGSKDVDILICVDER